MSADCNLLEVTATPNEDHPDDYSDIDSIDRLLAGDISYDDFFQQYMQRNRACVIADLPNDWHSYQHWTVAESGALDVDYIRQKLANRLPDNDNVPVADCGREHFNSHAKLTMRLADYLDYWQKRSFDDKQPQRLLYLKDWHLRQTLTGYEFYRTPSLFASDWLNEYLVDGGADDYRFVYIGPRGSWTPFHADVFGSFSWSTNIGGTKCWLMLPPGEQMKLQTPTGHLPFSVDEASLRACGCRYFVVRQQRGETVFVPSGWYHQVENETDAISINHNWFNGCNVWSIWCTLLVEYERVCAEIDDCRDMDDFEGHCQVMLRAVHGLHFAGLLDVLRHVVGKRTTVLRGEADCVDDGFDGWRFGRAHCLFDVQAIERVVCDMDAKVGDTYAVIRTECLRLRDMIAEIRE